MYVRAAFPFVQVFKTKPEPPAYKPRKRKKKLSITEYSPRITARSETGGDKDGLKTHSDIVTKLLTVSKVIEDSKKIINSY